MKSKNLLIIKAKRWDFSGTRPSILVLLTAVGLVISIGGCAAAAVGAAAGATAAVATDTRGGTTVISDQTLEHDVNNVLAAQLPYASFTVASFEHMVLLAGQVKSEEDKDKAELAVTNTHGVKKIWNHLAIRPNETMSDITQDTYITSAAKTRLIAQKGVNTNNIKVVTCAGVVYLLGKNAGEPVQISGAIQGIRQIGGVTKVVNLIQHKK
jgi:osmotically-inducible protein OsmY